ncbi:MAG: CopG family transcriptional regulator [Deltaproteobacteria bacterium]|nr:CopG family transcriptional regulator [Deltaproteobacteria bacterium]
MRTTLAIDDDVFAVARQKAQREHISVGAALSQLAREGIRNQHAALSKMKAPKSKFALLPARDETITTEHVRSLMDQEGI